MKIFMHIINMCILAHWHDVRGFTNDLGDLSSIQGRVTPKAQHGT